MSLVVAVKGTEGVVLAADSRVTLTSQTGWPIPYDNATKLLTLRAPHSWVGALTYGNATIGGRTPHSLMPEFELTLSIDRLTTLEYANALSAFFLSHWNASGQDPASGMTHFYVGGYSPQQPYGEIYYFAIPRYPAPVERSSNDFGMSWGGQNEIVNRIIFGHDPQMLPVLKQFFNLTDQQIEDFRMHLAGRIEYRVPYRVIALQDCVDLATYLIRATITAQSLATDLRGVGGAIDVATITRTEGFNWIQRKEIRGE